MSAALPAKLRVLDEWPKDGPLQDKHEQLQLHFYVFPLYTISFLHMVSSQNH